MRNLVIDPCQRYCRCGALCGPATTQCQKCRARLRWYRRKAWRINPARHQPDPAAAMTEEVITR
jgi:hypothetical protein